jgi:cytochrome c oxidase subunit 2
VYISKEKVQLVLTLLTLFVGIVEGGHSKSDAARSWQLNFQDPATPIMEGIINFHNHIMFFIVVIVIFVSWLMVRSISLFEEHTSPKAEKWTHSTLLEIVWTLVPAFVLLVIAVPSFALLFSMDEIIDPAVTLKVVGHQWYWSTQFTLFRLVV